MNKINLEEILDKIIDSVYANVPKEHKTDFQKKLKDNSQYQTCISAMKEACLQILELAADNASVDKIRIGKFYAEYAFAVNRESILDTINEIE